MNSRFIQYNAPLERNVNVIQWVKLFCQEQLEFCQLQVNFIIFEIQSVSVALHDDIELFLISFQVYRYFPSAIIICPIRRKVSSLE